MMDITKSREEFEIEFAAKRGLRIEQVISARHGDGYWDEARIVTAGIGLAWHFWKASRESIEVELPPRKSADIESEKYPDMTMYEAMMREGIWNDCIFECGKILRTAGIRIKGESE